MTIVTIDDEKSALELLNIAIRQVVKDAKIVPFSNPEQALAFARENPVDIAFMDIRMPGISGLEAAAVIKQYSPKVNIIFTTGYSEYMGQAFPLHPSGYIQKPVTRSKVEKELNNLLYPVDLGRAEIFAKTFGHFDLFVNGECVAFRRSKSKELLALLIDREGANLTTGQIAAFLLEDKPYDRSVKSQVNVYIADLKKTLDEVGAGYILVKTWGNLRIDPEKFTCDAYDYRKGAAYALNAFGGEYMTNYTWAEATLARFYWNHMG